MLILCQKIFTPIVFCLIVSLTDCAADRSPKSPHLESCIHHSWTSSCDLLDRVSFMETSTNSTSLSVGPRESRSLSTSRKWLAPLTRTRNGAYLVTVRFDSGQGELQILNGVRDIGISIVTSSVSARSSREDFVTKAICIQGSEVQ